MTSNELAEHVRKLNQQEQVKHELKKQAALKRIRELRERLREKDHSHN